MDYSIPGLAGNEQTGLELYEQLCFTLYFSHSGKYLENFEMKMSNFSSV